MLNYFCQFERLFFVTPSGAEGGQKISPHAFTGGLRSTHQQSTSRRIQHSQATAHAAAHTHPDSHRDIVSGVGVVHRESHAVILYFVKLKKAFPLWKSLLV